MQAAVPLNRLLLAGVQEAAEPLGTSTVPWSCAGPSPAPHTPSMCRELTRSWFGAKAGSCLPFSAASSLGLEGIV